MRDAEWAKPAPSDYGAIWYFIFGGVAGFITAIVIMAVTL